MLHEAIVRRVAVLSQLCSGLQAMNFLDTLRRLPDTFKPLFVYDKAQHTSDVIVSGLVFPSSLTAREEVVRDLFVQYLRERSEPGDSHSLSLSLSLSLSFSLFLSLSPPVQRVQYIIIDSTYGPSKFVLVTLCCLHVVYVTKGAGIGKRCNGKPLIL